MHLADYAAAKGLPLDFLLSLGLAEHSLSDGTPYVRIPYLRADGTLVSVRQRLALEGEGRFRWRSGDKIYPYGVWRLDSARTAGYLVICEGESDAQTLWYHGIPALGIPGANTWKAEWAAFLDGIPTIYVALEPDAGGEAMLKWAVKL